MLAVIESIEELEKSIASGNNARSLLADALSE